MLRKIFSLVALSMLLVPALASAQVEKFTVDPAHSEIGFTVRHFVSKVPGRFKQFEGEVLMDPKDPTTMVINGKVKTASISTDNEKRDGHLQSPDFFDAPNNPEITFKSKKVTKDGEKYTVLGDLTMRGVTKEVPLQVEVLGVEGRKAGFEATGRVNRKDYGINWNKTLDSGGTLLSDDVDIVLRIEANKAEAEATAAKK